MMPCPLNLPICPFSSTICLAFFATSTAVNLRCACRHCNVDALLSALWSSNDSVLICKRVNAYILVWTSRRTLCGDERLDSWLSSWISSSLLLILFICWYFWCCYLFAQRLVGHYCVQRFAAVIMRIREPKTTALIFASGKMVLSQSLLFGSWNWNCGFIWITWIGSNWVSCTLIWLISVHNNICYYFPHEDTSMQRVRC